MLSVKSFSELLAENNYEQAILFCKNMIEKHPEFSYYHFWLDKLTNITRTTTNNINNRSLMSQPFTESLDTISDSIHQLFLKYPYHLCKNESVDLPIDILLQEKNKLVNTFPFKGDIYLPTSKINIPDQINGLRRVAELVTEENKNVSKTRFESLKEIIKATGKKRVFILGNGPSLKRTDLNLLKDEITIGFNGIFLHDSFTPTIYVVEDHLVAEDRVCEISKYQCPVKLFPSYLGYCLPVEGNTIFLNHLSRKSFPVDTDFSDDVGEISYTGGTVTYTGMQIAASLGFEEIYLLGVDANYTVENVERNNDYGTGVLESKSDDVNHFDSSYFGKGYRWHDPNVHTMLQAYRKVRNYAQLKNIKIANATIGGELDVFPRVDFYSLFEHDISYPKTAVIDFTHIDWLCATGIVKKNMFDGWSKHSLFNVHSQHPEYVSAYQKVKNDVYADGADKAGIWAALRTLMEFSPKVLYIRPTHDRPALSIMQLVMPLIMNKPFVIHYMDDWLSKIEMNHGKEFAKIYYQAMHLMFSKANRVLTISKKMADYLADEFDVEPTKLQVVHNYIQEPSPLALPKDKTCKVIRYFGGMEPDMSLASILQVANAVETINSDVTPVRFEIYTGQNYIDRFAEHFNSFSQTTIKKQNENYQVYLALLESSDLNVLCYNFDEKSELYLKYSMANKLPEIIGSNIPFLAIGSVEIGTITYLLEEQYPFIVKENNPQEIEKIISHILFDKKSASEQYFNSISRLKEEFSTARNQFSFQNMLRTVSKESLAEYSDLELTKTLQLTDLLTDSSRGKQRGISIFKVLLGLKANDLIRLNLLMRSHGVTWQFKETQPEVEKILRKQRISEEERITLISFLITSLEHDRFTNITDRIQKAIK